MSIQSYDITKIKIKRTVMHPPIHGGGSCVPYGALLAGGVSTAVRVEAIHLQAAPHLGVPIKFVIVRETPFICSAGGERKKERIIIIKLKHNIR